MSGKVKVPNMNKRKAHKKLRSQANLDKGLLNRGWHSKSYHRHFEGYTEVTKLNAKGEMVIQRVYVGDYYRLDLPRKKRLLLRGGYALAWLVSCLLFILAASRPISANSAWYLAIPQMLALCSLAVTAFALIAHCTSKRDMTIGEWKSSSIALKRRSLFSAILLGITALLTLLHPFFQSVEWGPHLLCVFLNLLAGALTMMIYLLEKEAPYLTFPSTQPVPENGTYIDV